MLLFTLPDYVLQRCRCSCNPCWVVLVPTSLQVAAVLAYSGGVDESNDQLMELVLIDRDQELPAPVHTRVQSISLISLTGRRIISREQGPISPRP